MSELPLQDIHLPPAIGFWPLATGWWGLSTLLLLVPLLLWWLRRYRQRLQLFKEARQRLATIACSDSCDDREKLIQLSALLRRVAISIEPREAVASLNGDAWLSYLDRQMPDAPFSRGAGRCLVEAPYRSQVAQPDIAALVKLSQRWLALQRRQRGWW